MTRLQADLILVLCAAIWGSAFAFQKTAMGHLTPMEFVACRCIVATAALAPLALWESRQRPWGGDPVDATPGFDLAWQAAIAGLLFFVGAALQQEGMVTATVTSTGFLTVLYVVIVPMMTWAIGAERPTGLVWGAVLLSFAGAWMMMGAGRVTLAYGDLLVMASAVLWAAHVVSLRFSSARGLPITFTMAQFAVVAGLAMLVVGWNGGLSIAGARAAWVEILFVGILSSALTFGLLTIAMRHAAPSEAVIILSLETLFSALVGYLWFGDRLGWLGWLGAACILAATIVVPLAGRRPAQPATGT